MSVSEKIGRGAWEAARFRREYEGSTYSRFLCRVVVGNKTLTGIIDVRKKEEKSKGTLSIPMMVTIGSPLLEAVKENNFHLADKKGYDEMAQGLGVNLGQRYGDLLIDSLGRMSDRLGVGTSLIVSNEFSGGSASRAAEPGDIGAAMGLAQHIMESLPGEWRITPEPVIGR